MNEAHLARHFLEVIPGAMRAIRFEMRRVAQADLSVPMFRILAQLSSGPATNRELAENLGVSEPGACRLVASLVKKGYVRQARCEKDRRRVYVELTSSGLKKFETIRGVAQGAFRAQFSKLSAEKRDALKVGLSVLEEAFR